MKIPRYIRRTPISVASYDGETATGPSFGTPASILVVWEGARRMYTTVDGRQAIASATIYVDPNDGIDIDDLVTKGSETYRVVEIIDNTDQGLMGPDHYEALLTPHREGGRR